jgi:hypothetical protein
LLGLRDEGREATLLRAVPAAEAPLATVVTMAGLGAAAVAQGAYHLRGQVLAGLLLGAALLGALAGRRLAASDLRFHPLAVCAALAGWALVSATVAGVPAAAMPTMALLAGVMLVVVLCRPGGDSVTTGLIAIGVLVAVSGLAGVAWRHEPWTLEDQGLWRAATTLTYANAAAGLLVPLALLAAGRLVSRPGSRAGAATMCVLLAGAGATLSRGGFLALLLGGVLLGRAAGGRRLLAAVAGPAAGALVILAALAPSMVVGRPPRPLLAVAGMAAGLAVVVILATRPRAAAAVLVVASALVAGAAGLTGALDPASASRMTLASPDRANEAKAALRVAADHPLTGAGPGRVVLSWQDGDGQRLVAQYAHNEYLQTWAELGLIGLVLVLALGLAVARHIRTAGPLDPAAAAAAAGLAAVALHSSMDFLWHIPAIPLVCAALVAVACPPRQGAPR